MLWVHGYTVDSTIWSDIWAHLPDWVHYGIDLPGHGLSPRMNTGVTLAQFGLLLADAAINLGIRHVVGLSVGTMIALEIVLRRPSAFATLTLAAPALAGGPLEHDVGLRYRELFQLYRTRGAGPWMTELWMRRPPDTFAHASPRLRARLSAIIDHHRWEELANPADSFIAFTRERQDPGILAASPTRPLYVVGEHEFPAFRQTTAMLREVRPDAGYIELPRAGHLCLLDSAKEAAELLSRHWRR